MTGEPLLFCNRILPGVSRTFAINIRVLSGDLHRAVLCAYLFCRVVDTAEDSEHLSPALRIALLESYRTIFSKHRFDPDSIHVWIQSWGALDTANPEHQLIAGLQNVVEVFRALPEPSRLAIESCVTEMSAGMCETVARKQTLNENLFTLSSIEDLNRYCHYVAGTVGKMLTELFIINLPELAEPERARLRSSGPSFALGLQMTNIIKDCHADFQRGWCYLPAGVMAEYGVHASEFFTPAFARPAQDVLNHLIRRTAHHLDVALDYTLTLPPSSVRLRLFNLWSLFFAIRTLRRAWNNPALLTELNKVKISRFEVYLTILQTAAAVRSDTILRWSYRRIRRVIPL